MPSDRIVDCFTDIVQAIDQIMAWVDKVGDIQTAIDDDMVRSAIERKLLVISEAAIRLDKLDSKAGPDLAPDVDWRGARGIGNFIRHQYDSLNAEIIADVVRDRLPGLGSSAKAALDKLQANR